MSIKISGTGSFIPKNIIKNNNFLDSEFYDKNGEPYPNSNKDIIEKFELIFALIHQVCRILKVILQLKNF